MNKSTIVALVAFLFAAFTLTGCNVAPKADSRASFTMEAKSTKSWFETNVKGFDKQLSGAGGYILFPSVGQAGVGFFGGTFGRGAVYNSSGEQIGWAAMSSGSVGLQLGAQGYKMAIVLQDDNTLRSFKAGKWGGDVSATAVAANEGAAAKKDFSDGVVVYVGDQAGLMAGISVALANVRYKNMDDVE
jgi:lipid-binding SYLF domain-containing protein